jgi:flagellar protein FlaI
MGRDIVEKYSITSDEFQVDVNITGGKGKVKIYEVVFHEIEVATKALLDKVKEELIGAVRISAEEILDPKALVKLKSRFQKRAQELIESKLPGIDKKREKYLVMNLMIEMLGLGYIDILLNDVNLEEVVVMSANEPIRIFHKKYGWLATNVYFDTEMKIRDNFNTIARRVGRQITTLNPLLDAHLLTGDRANAVLYPISSKGNTLTIRKFARDPWTVTDFIKNKTGNSDIFALIWFAIQYESNIIVSGGTGSGKTSLLNVCMPFIPPNHRIISIEDTRELQLPSNLYWCPLTTRQPNPEGKGAITMLDLLVNALRMRPDRIILGEMRKKPQAEVLFEAMHTGHSVYATVHADSVISTIQRLTNPPIEVPANLLSAVNMNVVMFRNRRENIRRIFQAGEFLPSEEEGKSTIKANIIYRWNAATDNIEPHNKPIRLLEDFSRFTGLNELEIKEDIAKKKKVLEWMVKHNLRDSASVGKVFNAYYLDPEYIVSAASKNNDPKKIIEDLKV